MSNKRVWHVCSNRWNSAITEYALSTAKALDLRAGWTSSYSARAGSPGAARARALGLEGPNFSRFGLGDLRAFIAAGKALRPDLVILYGGPETFLARFLGDVPCLRFRGQDSDGTAPLPLISTRLAMSHCRALLVPSKHVQSRFQAVMGKKPVHLVPLGLDPSRYYFEELAAQNSERPLLRILGRLDPVKGHAHFFSLFGQLLLRWPSTEPRPFLEVIGQEANLTTAMIRESAAASHLIEGKDWRFVAERIPPSDLPALLSSSHLGVIPSLSSEIICRVAEEFLLAGCPLLVSGVGSLEECLFNEGAGASYRGLTISEQIELLQAWILRSFRESKAEKKQRAEEAAALFSFEQMGATLERVLETHRVELLKSALTQL